MKRLTLCLLCCVGLVFATAYTTYANFNSFGDAIGGATSGKPSKGSSGSSNGFGGSSSGGSSGNGFGNSFNDSSNSFGNNSSSYSGGAGPLDTSVFGGARTVVSLRDLQKFLKNARGYVVVVNFFATWCGPCREEIPGLVSIAKSMQSKKVVVVSLSIDKDATALQSFIKKMGINYSVARAASDVTQHFGVQSIPHNVIYSREGDMIVNESGFVSEKDLRRFLEELAK